MVGRPAYLGDAQLAGGQLLLVLVHLLVALGLGALQLLAALHHALHLGLHLADVEARHGELLVDQPAALVLLWEGQDSLKHTIAKTQPTSTLQSNSHHGAV